MDDLLIAYENNKDFLENFRETLVTVFETVVLQERKYYRLQSKLITHDELAACLQERNQKGLREFSELNAVPNLVKIRVVTYSDGDIDFFLNYIFNLFELSKTSRSYDHRKFTENEPGIKKIEYIMQFPFSVMERFEQYAKYRGFKFQLEMLTLLQHAKMVLSGIITLKPDLAYPKSIPHQLTKIAVLLDQADENFEELKKDFDAAESSLLKFGADPHKYSEEQPIDLATLIEACMSQSIINYLDHLIAGQSQARYLENFSMLDFYIKELAALDITKMAALLTLLFELQKPLMIFVKHLLVNSSASSYLFSGVSLGILANYLLAEKNDPGFALELYKKLYTDEYNQSPGNYDKIRLAYLKTQKDLGKE